jgi:3-oxoadipate enol-lactonase
VLNTLCAPISWAGRRLRSGLRSLTGVPAVEIPEGRWLELPRRGRTWVTELEGPKDAPTIVLLHAVGCTGMLTWFPVVHQLAEHFHVVVFDQRWHGRGIVSEHFSLHDCADDVAAVVTELGLLEGGRKPIIAGYSMGSVVAQRVWRQHPDVVGGLVLGATTDHFRTNGHEMFFHNGMEISMGALRALARNRVVRRAARAGAEVLDLEPNDIDSWALAEWRSTSPWAVAQAMAALGRHHSTPWLERIDVPTAVMVPQTDWAIPPARQRRVAELIPGATVHEADCGHSGVVLESAIFAPAFLDAALDVAARMERPRPRAVRPRKKAAATAG